MLKFSYGVIMAVFNKYSKRRVVVGAQLLSTDIEIYGGTMYCGNYMLQTANGCLHSLDNVIFPLLYQETEFTSALVGNDDWD